MKQPSGIRHQPSAVSRQPPASKWQRRPSNVMLALAGLVVAPLPGPAQARTRAIRLTRVVRAEPRVLYDLFATSEGAQTLFPGALAAVGARVGEEYRVAFDPEHSPDGAENGTKGCRILRLDPPRAIAFEWRGPPWAEEMNVTPFPTWVEVSFTPGPGDSSTTVTLLHHGFGTGPGWDRAYDFFDSAWRRTLDGLQQRFE